VARLYSNLPKRKAKFRGEQPLHGTFRVPLSTQEKGKEKSKGPNGQHLTVHMESYLSLMEEESGKAGFQGAQPPGGAWGVPTISLFMGKGGDEPLNLLYSPLSAIVLKERNYDDGLFKLSSPH